MVEEYKLRLLALDDDSVICVYRGQAIMLSKVIASYAQRLIKLLHPEDVRIWQTPARSIELAREADESSPGSKYYIMTKSMEAVLTAAAKFDGLVTQKDIVTLCSMVKGTASSKLSMLTTNGYLTRADAGKYLVSPAGRAYLLDHANQ